MQHCLAFTSPEHFNKVFLLSRCSTNKDYKHLAIFFLSSSHFTYTTYKSQAWFHTLIILVLRRQIQKDSRKYETSLGYRKSSRTARGI